MCQDVRALSRASAVIDPRYGLRHGARFERPVLVDLDNAAGFLPGGSFQEFRERKIESPDFNATASSFYSFDRRAQQLIRKRVWRIDGESPVEDFCRYRMFFPAELEHLLECKAFRVVGMFDNKELKESELTGPTLYVAAKFQA